MASSANHLCCSGGSKSNISFGSSPVEKTPQANLSGNLSQNKVSSACRLRAAECCKYLLVDVRFAALSWKRGKERAVCYSLCFGRVSWFIRPCTAPAHRSLSGKLWLLPPAGRGGNPAWRHCPAPAQCWGDLAHRSSGEERLQRALVPGSPHCSGFWLRRHFSHF